MIDIENKEYYHGLDLLRALMMLYGVIWHTGCWLYIENWGFLENKIHNSKYIFVTASFPHLFRMETFFLVAGFLSCMVLRRKDRKEFFKARLKRVLLPLILGCVIVNLLLILYFKWLGVFYISGKFGLGFIVFHGWFLACLFIFTIIDTLCNRTNFFQKEYIIIPLAFVACVEACDLWKLYHSLHLDKIRFANDFYDLFLVKPLTFFIYYYLGSRLYVRRDWLKNLNNKDVRNFTILSVIFAFCANRLDNHYWHLDQSKIFIVMAGILMSLALFLIFYKFNKPNGKIVNYLINSSIAIYILHLPLVLLFCYYFDHLSINNITFFIMVSTSTFICSFGIYEIIKRFKITKLIFGLKK